jgi:hypothetical protein
MEHKEIDINLIKPSEYNPRSMSEFDYVSLKKNLQEFGLVQPLIINNDFTLIGGHQRLKALKELGYKKVNIIQVNLSKEQEKVLNLSLNKISGDWDQDKLNLLIKEIDDDAIIGFTKQEINEIKLSDSFDFTDIDKEFNKLSKEEDQFVLWTAKLKEKDYQKMEIILKDLKKKNKLSQFSSPDSNALILKILCETYGKSKNIIG